MKRPRMIDVARRVGVSQATVSLVLNDIPGRRISPSMRETVLAAAKELGYEKPQPVEREAARTILLILNEISEGPHAPPLIEGVRNQAEARGASVLTILTCGNMAYAEAALESINRSHLVGVINATLATQIMPTLPRNLGNLPMVLLNCHQPQSSFSSVIPGDVIAAFTATTALIEAGHRRIAMINGSQGWLTAADDRLKGYRQALTTHDIAVDKALIKADAWKIDTGRERMNELLDLPEPPTAVFCFSDRVALGAYEAIFRRGLKVPDDISIVGFDNESLSAELAPPLTTLILPHEEMGAWAVNELFDRMDQPKRSTMNLKMECALVERSSVAPPPPQAMEGAPVARGGSQLRRSKAAARSRAGRG